MRRQLYISTFAVLAGGFSVAAHALEAAPAAAGNPAAPSSPAAAEPVPAAATDTAPPPDGQATAATEISAADASAERDPLEGFNRAMWGLNDGIDKIVLKPVTVVYRTVTPRPARRGLSHVLANLSEPWSAINALLQGKPGRAFNALGRFLINSTIGVGGLADHASEFGLKPTPEDFGQTLAAWGVRSSAYVVLPVLGPSTVRDGIGTGVATYADPYRIALREWSGLTRTQRYGVTAFTAVDARSNLIDAGADAFLKSSADPYATARSAYLQRRAAEIADQDEGSTAAETGSDDAAVAAALKDIGADADAPANASSPATRPPAPPREDTPTPVSPQ